jgi:hypothetical protein
MKLIPVVQNAVDAASAEFRKPALQMYQRNALPWRPTRCGLERRRYAASFLNRISTVLPTARAAFIKVSS